MFDGGSQLTRVGSIRLGAAVGENLGELRLTRGGKVYQAQKAIMNPNHEKKNTRPYMLMGLKKGIDRAFRLIGFTSGADQRSESLNPMMTVLCLERK